MRLEGKLEIENIINQENQSCAGKAIWNDKSVIAQKHNTFMLELTWKVRGPRSRIVSRRRALVSLYIAVSLLPSLSHSARRSSSYNQEEFSYMELVLFEILYTSELEISFQCSLMYLNTRVGILRR